MKKLISILLGLLFTVTFAQDGFPRTVVDGQGRELVLEQAPTRIVALFNGNLGTLATLGVLPVGTLANQEMLDDPLYFEDSSSIASVQGEDGYSAELIAALEPDLIMAIRQEQVDELSGIAPVYLSGSLSSLEDTIIELRRAATLFGLEDDAEAIISQFEDRLEAYALASPGDVSVMFTGLRADGIAVRTQNSTDCSLLNQIAMCDWPDPTGGASWSFATTSEGVLDLDPDVIIYGNWTGGNLSNDEIFTRLDSDLLWQELTAVQNDQVLITPGYNNPIASSLIGATKILDTFAPQIYPEVFDGPLTNEQVQEILSQ
ncbi:MAG: ABC transporter substrate-binding protein [Deinococcota bacterium]